MIKIIYLLLFTATPLLSQINDLQKIRIKELNKNARKSNNSIYIKNQFNKNNDLLIFLINESNDTLKINTGSIDNYHINFQKEVLDNSLKWKKETIDRYCIVGNSSYILKIPPNHYTWEKIESFKYFGDYKTKMRVSLNLGSENILSKEFLVSYNTDFFLSKEEQQLKNIDKILSISSNLSRKDSIGFLRMKSDAYIEMNKFKKSYIFCDSIQNTDLKNDIIGFNKAKSLYKFIFNNYEKISELERLSLISKNIILLKNINLTNEPVLKKRVIAYINYLNSSLLSIAEFNKKYPERNKNYSFEIDFSGVESVEILFKKETKPNNPYTPLKRRI